MRLAGWRAKGALGDVPKIAIKEDVQFSAKAKAFARLTLTPRSRRSGYERRPGRVLVRLQQARGSRPELDHLLAASLGWPAEDGYKALRNAEDLRAALSPDALDAVGEVAFGRLLEPQLRRPAPV